MINRREEKLAGKNETWRQECRTGLQAGGSRQRGKPASASRKENEVANFPSHLDQVLTLLRTYGRSQALTPSLWCPCGRLAVCREVILGAGHWDFCYQHVTTLSLLALYPEGKRSPALGESISCSSCPDDPEIPGEECRQSVSWISGPKLEN